MTTRPIDIIVYGASGFTGQKVAQYIQRNLNLKWAIAGRSEIKLKKLRNELDVNNPPSILLADVENVDELVAIFTNGRLVLNCTGPYRFLGNRVIEACLAAGTDYMDISGEPQFMEESYLRYNETAISKNILILHSCAFDSVPADLGCLFVMKQYPARCCISIESFLTLNCGPEGIAGHYTTYECAVHGFGDVMKLKKIRKDIEQKYSPPKITSNGPKLERKSGFFFDDRMKKYCFPFMGADASVVRTSQRVLSITSGELVWPQYAAYATVDSWGYMVATAFFGGVFQTLASTSWGRSMLLSYPETFTNGIFSHKGPSDAQLASTSFTMQFFGRGFTVEPSPETPLPPTRPVIATVSGPEPGYVATPAILISLASLLLTERAKTLGSSASSLPRGGVMTPAAAFSQCPDVFERLLSSGITFTLLEDANSDGGGVNVGSSSKL